MCWERSHRGPFQVVGDWDGERCPFFPCGGNGLATLWHVGAAMGRPLMCEHSQSSFHISSHQLEIVRVTRRKACLPFLVCALGWSGWGENGGVVLGCIYVVSSGVPGGVCFPACTRHFWCLCFVPGVHGLGFRIKKLGEEKFLCLHIFPQYMWCEIPPQNIFLQPRPLQFPSTLSLWDCVQQCCPAKHLCCGEHTCF